MLESPDGGIVDGTSPWQLATNCPVSSPNFDLSAEGQAQDLASPASVPHQHSHAFIARPVPSPSDNDSGRTLPMTHSPSPTASGYDTLISDSGSASAGRPSLIKPFPCQKGCDRAFTYEKDRRRHHNSEVHRPDLFGQQGAQRGPAGSFQCGCGYSCPRLDNHKRHTEACRRPVSVPFRCKLGHSHDSFKEHMRHITDPRQCGARRGRPLTRNMFSEEGPHVAN